MQSYKNGHTIELVNRNVLIILIIVLLLAGGAYLLLSQNKQPAAVVQPTPTTAIQQATPSSSPSATTTGTATPSTQPSKPASATTITVTATGFSPQTITIKAGTKVTWINQSGITANVSSDPHPVHTDYPPLNLGSFANGSSVSLVFDTAGTHGYHNHLNPSQKGTIIVQ